MGAKRLIPNMYQASQSKLSGLPVQPFDNDHGIISSIGTESSSSLHDNILSTPIPYEYT